MERDLEYHPNTHILTLSIQYNSPIKQAARHEELTENSTDTVYDLVDGILTRLSSGGEADAVTASSLSPLMAALNTASRAR